MPGYKDWIDAIDIKVDYFSAFMKAWIAFNAWYNNSGEITGRTDKECIEFIGSRPNRFKTYIENLLVTDTPEGHDFKSALAALHESLLSAAITTQEYIGVCQTISFAEVAVKNTNANENFLYRSIRYECSRSHGKITTVVTNTSSSTELLRFQQDEYNLDELKQQSSYQNLTLERQNKCEGCYKKLTPYISKSVLTTESREGYYLEIGPYRFVNNTSDISQAIVTILYLVRCCLAHGDVSPDESANKVYRFAYEVLCMPLKKLK